MSELNCPICKSPAKVEPYRASFDLTVQCTRCGNYNISRSAKDDFEDACAQVNIDGILKTISSPVRGQPVFKLLKTVAQRQGSEISRSIISHVLRKMHSSCNNLSVITEDIADILRNNPMPTTAEQANNLIMLMAERQPSSGSAATIDASDYGLIGLKILPHPHEVESLHFLKTSLKEMGLLTQNNAHQFLLSLKGWQKYEELKRSVEISKRAFVAMEFPDDVKRGEGKDYFFQDILLDNYLIPATKMTGFDLGNPLRSNPQAGNLHARLEVEIRAARFVVAELSDGNNGAYWEAGFARGIGKPVIYMCKKGAPRHFDVGSDYIVLWEKDKPEKAADELKSIIRATLFGEAIMQDD